MVRNVQVIALKLSERTGVRCGTPVSRRDAGVFNRLCCPEFIISGVNRARDASSASCTLVSPSRATVLLKNSVARVRQTQNISIGTQILDQLLLITEDFRGLCFAEDLDHVAVLRATFRVLI